MFESIVNSNRFKTSHLSKASHFSLRVLLIQIGLKQLFLRVVKEKGLRVLLIQIGLKHQTCLSKSMKCLRVLLIQIGLKLSLLLLGHL